MPSQKNSKSVWSDVLVNSINYKLIILESNELSPISTSRKSTLKSIKILDNCQNGINVIAVCMYKIAQVHVKYESIKFSTNFIIKNH